MSPETVKQARKTPFKAVAVGERRQTESELNSPETKGRRGLKSRNRRNLGHQCFLNDLTQRKIKLSLICLTGGSFTTWSKEPTKVRLLPTTEAEGAIFCDNYISKGWLSGP